MDKDWMSIIISVILMILGLFYFIGMMILVLKK
jgi:hypothetical protein